MKDKNLPFTSVNWHNFQAAQKVKPNFSNKCFARRLAILVLLLIGYEDCSGIIAFNSKHLWNVHTIDYHRQLQMLKESREGNKLLMASILSSQTSNYSFIQIMWRYFKNTVLCTVNSELILKWHYLPNQHNKAF